MKHLKRGIGSPLAIYAYNTTEQRTSRISPYEIIFGKKAMFLFSYQMTINKEGKTAYEYVI